jgi:DNA-binding transcriptional ArsR family regulator
VARNRVELSEIDGQNGGTVHVSLRVKVMGASYTHGLHEFFRRRRASEVEWHETEAYRRFLQAQSTAQVFAALASAVRVRLIELLPGGAERTIAELVSLINVRTPGEPGVIYNVNEVSTAAVGRHMGVLYRAGVVGWRRQGNRSYYRLLQPWVAEACRQAEELNPVATVSGSDWGSGARQPRHAEPGDAADPAS